MLYYFQKKNEWEDIKKLEDELFSPDGPLYHLRELRGLKMVSDIKDDEVDW